MYNKIKLFVDIHVITQCRKIPANLKLNKVCVTLRDANGSNTVKQLKLSELSLSSWAKDVIRSILFAYNVHHAFSFKIVLRFVRQCTHYTLILLFLHVCTLLTHPTL